MQRRYSNDGRQVHEKVLNITHPQGKQIKTTMRHYLTPVRMVTIKTRTSVGEDVDKREPLCTAGRNADGCSHCGKQYGGSSNKLKIRVTI